MFMITFSGTNSILRYIKSPSSSATSAILDSSSTPELTFGDNKLHMMPVHEEHCEPSSKKEDCDNSNVAKQCSAIKEKHVPKKLPRVQVAGDLWLLAS